ncbi:MAG: hypothetical protein KIS96_07705 [Bauldia sp.]|nr:hypothetical protein [Bauldia sp.]
MRKFKLKSLARLAVSASAVAMAFPVAAEEPVTFERLSNQEPANWLTVYGNYAGWRYSELDEINRDNVADLRVAIAVPIAMRAGLGGANYAVPLVDDGFLYTNDSNNAVVKIDLKSGRGDYLWTTALAASDIAAGRVQGNALWQNAIIANTRDAHIVSIDRETGEVNWDQLVGVPGESTNAAPVALENIIIVSQSAGDAGTRGWAAGLDASTGDELWRFYIVPGPGEPGHETWPQDNDAWMTGGGGLWVAPTYDVATNIVLWGTGNPAPSFDPEFRAGDNLYTNSSVALDASTGELVWYFQYLPGDYLDHDAIGINQLYDIEIDGAVRQVLGHINRTGYFYTMDRQTGEFILATPVQTNIDWTSGIDPKTGLPVEYNPDVGLQDYGNPVRRDAGPVDNCGGQFVTGTWQPAYDPNRQVVYTTYVDTSCWMDVVPAFDATRSAEERWANVGLGGQFTLYEENFRVGAIDVVTSSIQSAELPAFTQSGVLATAGNVIFFGDSYGTFSAHDSDTLDQLWSINVGSSMRSPPIAFEMDGKQYIAIQSGGSGGFAGVSVVGAPPNSAMLWVFSL